VRPRIELVFRWLGGAGVAFLLLLAAYAALGWIAPNSGFGLILEIAAIVAGLWLAIRILRLIARQALWRLRHRLIVTYLFIAGVPLLLIIGLAALAGYMLVYQLAAYLVTTELERRIDGLGLTSGATLPVPAGGFPARGVLQRDGIFYLFSTVKAPQGDVIVTVPLTREYLAGLAPSLGLVGIDQPNGAPKTGRAAPPLPPARAARSIAA